MKNHKKRYFAKIISEVNHAGTPPDSKNLLKKLPAVNKENYITVLGDIDAMQFDLTEDFIKQHLTHNITLTVPVPYLENHEEYGSYYEEGYRNLEINYNVIMAYADSLYDSDSDSSRYFLSGLMHRFPKTTEDALRNYSKVYHFLTPADKEYYKKASESWANDANYHKKASEWSTNSADYHKSQHKIYLNYLNKIGELKKWTENEKRHKNVEVMLLDLCTSKNIEQMSSSDLAARKKNLVSWYIDQIAAAKNPEELLKLRERIKQSPLINTHRHLIWDSFFKKDSNGNLLHTASHNRLLQAVDVKLIQWGEMQFRKTDTREGLIDLREQINKLAPSDCVPGKVDLMRRIATELSTFKAEIPDPLPSAPSAFLVLS